MGGLRGSEGPPPPEGSLPSGVPPPSGRTGIFAIEFQLIWLSMTFATWTKVPAATPTWTVALVTRL